MLRIGGPQGPPQQGPPPGAPPPEMPPQELPPETPPEAGGKFDAEKVDPVIVHYMTSDMGPFECGRCDHFDGQGGCGIVAGPIDPKGVCNVFTSVPSQEGPDDSQELPTDLPPQEELQ